MEQRTSGAGSRESDGNVGARTRELSAEAQQHLDELRERFAEMNERVMGFVRERPGTAILIALGAGYLIGRVLRS
jgi:ElaB/YqjD/DUF883 family membrane-anchored ribosome-binding protein